MTNKMKRRIGLVAGAVALATAAGCADPNPPSPSGSVDYGLVVDKDLHVLPWGNYFYLRVFTDDGGAWRNVWTGVSEADWLDCQSYPNQPNEWNRGGGCHT